jgi:DNA polymerase-3 subunit chi
MACEVWFYHLEQTALDQALPDLLEKTLARGWRALVRSPSPDRLAHLDAWLWTYRDDAFLAHGMAEEEESRRQPILLTGGAENPNGAQAVFLLDDAEPGALDAFERCIVMFDGRDDEAMAKARGRWKAIKAAGHPASYWRQSEAGRWEKQA